jgi:hypothetical protein
MFPSPGQFSDGSEHPERSIEHGKGSIVPLALNDLENGSGE